MKKTHKITSIVVLLLFLFNATAHDITITPVIALPENCKLAVASIFSKEMGNLELALETYLQGAARGSQNVNMEDLIAYVEKYSNSIFDDTHFFVHEEPELPLHLRLPEGYRCVMARTNKRDQDNVRTYYVVFSLRGDKDNGFDIETYTKEEWNELKTVKGQKTLPRRKDHKPEDAEAKRRYKEINEKIIDPAIRDIIAGKKGEFAEVDGRANSLGWNELYPERESPNSYMDKGLLDHIQLLLNDVFFKKNNINIHKAFKGKNIVFLRMKDNNDYPVIYERDSISNELVPVQVTSHTSENAVYFFLDDLTYDGLVYHAGELPNEVWRGILERVVHEIGVIQGLLSRVVDGVILNDLSYAYRAANGSMTEVQRRDYLSRAKSIEELQGLLDREPVDLDHLQWKDPATGERVVRDYAAGKVLTGNTYEWQIYDIVKNIEDKPTLEAIRYVIETDNSDIIANMAKYPDQGVLIKEAFGHDNVRLIKEALEGKAGEFLVKYRLAGMKARKDEKTDAQRDRIFEKLEQVKSGTTLNFIRYSVLEADTVDAYSISLVKGDCGCEDFELIKETLRSEAGRLLLDYKIAEVEIRKKWKSDTSYNVYDGIKALEELGIGGDDKLMILETILKVLESDHGDKIDLDGLKPRWFEAMFINVFGEASLTNPVKFPGVKLALEAAGIRGMVKAMIDRVEGDFISPAAVGLRNVTGTFSPLYQTRYLDDLGISDFEKTKKNVDLHKELGQNVMQWSPFTISSASNSPYSVQSSRSIDPLYISIEKMFTEFGVPEEKVRSFMEENAAKIEELRAAGDRVNYKDIWELKMAAFKIVWEIFRTDGTSRLYKEFKNFKDDNKGWLEDHMLYMVLKEEHMAEEQRAGIHWTKWRKWDWRLWEKGLRDRDPAAIRRAKERYQEKILFKSFQQFIADRQYNELKEYATSQGVQFVVDIPIALDGADIWLNPGVFGLSPSNGYKRKVTMGCPSEPAYPAGQYWQFYSYDWSNPETMKFVRDLFRFNQKRTPYIRLDHVLGFYRAFLFTEDVDGQMTLRKLGLYEKIRNLQKKAIEKGTEQAKRKAAKKAYKLIKKKLFSMRDSLPPELRDTLSEDSLKLAFDDKGNLTQGTLLRIAREVPEKKQGKNLPKKSPWKRTKNVVEGLVHNGKKMWDFIKISPENNAPEEESMYKYLFPDSACKTEPEVRENDSIRLAYFKYGPGEKIISEFLRLAQEQGTTVIAETLGVVPEEVQKSVERLGLTNYIPVIWGDGGGAYHPDNHILNAFVTFGLHDSVTMKTRWEKEISRKTKIAMLNRYLGKGKWGQEDITNLTYEVRKMLLKMVYLSRSGISVLTWVDLLGLGEKYRINEPGVEDGQWEVRLPKDLAIEYLLAAARGDYQNSTPRAIEVVKLIRDLTELGNRLIPRIDPNEKKILNVTPAVGGEVMQIRELDTHPFLVDAYVQGDTPGATMIIKDKTGKEIRVPMERARISKASRMHGLPENVHKYTVRWRPPETGVYEFQIEVEGIPERSKTGHLVAVAPGAELNPLLENYALKHIVAKISSDAAKAKQVKIIKEMEPCAQDVGVMIAPPVSRYTLFMSHGFYKRNEYKEDVRRFGSRFKIKQLMADRPDTIARRINDAIEQGGLDPRDIIVQLTEKFDKDEDISGLKKLAKKGVKFITIDTMGLQDEKEAEVRFKCRRNIYSLMLLARNMNKDTPEDSKLYRLLRFYVSYYLGGGKADVIDDYMEALRTNRVIKLINTTLSWRPMQRLEAPDPDIVSATLMSA